MNDLNRMSLISTFEELKSRGCIEKGRILDFDDDVNNHTFWAEPMKNRIVANEAFRFPDDDLIKKYILLHEEGHFQPINWKIILKYNTLFVSIVLIILICATILPTFYLICIIEFLLFFSYGIRSMSKAEEIKADIYSCTCLKNIFHVSKPSDVIKEASNFIIENILPVRKKNRNKSIINKIIRPIYRYYVYTHLPVEKTIIIIKKEVEEK